MNKDGLDFGIRNKLGLVLYPEKLEIMFTRLIGKYSDEGQEELKSVVALVKEKHKGFYRQEHTPYFAHCLLTTINILENPNTTYNDIIIALLHDTLEDTDLTINEIKEKFGDDVSELVYDLSKKGKEVDPLSEEDYYKKIFSDERLARLKGSDRLANIYSLYFAPNWEKRELYIEETKTKILPFIKIYDEKLFNELNHLLSFVETHSNLNDEDIERLYILSEVKKN